MKTFYETIKNSISLNKEMLEIMPKNGIKKQRELENKIVELKDRYINIQKNIYKEIEIRYKRLDKMTENEQIDIIGKKLRQLNEYEIINSEKKSFEKMQLDRLVYDINGYYKKDLGATNKDIYECIKRFRNVGVNISVDDFNISEYVYDYMSVLMTEAEKGKLNSSIIKNKFEEVYWKCSDLMYHILVNIRVIYDKNVKQIDEYYVQKCKIENQKKNKSIREEREKTYNQYREMVNADERRIIDSFVNGINDIGSYNEKNINQIFVKLVNKEKNEIDSNEYPEIKENIRKLYDNLIEYNKFLQYRFISDEVLSIKKRLATEQIREDDVKKKGDKKEKKTKGKKLSKYEEAAKNVENKIKEIYKLNDTINDNNLKTGLLKKKVEKISDKEKKVNEVERDKKILELKELYNILDNAKFEECIEKNLDETTSIYDTLRIATYYYTFLAKTLIKNNSEILAKEITETIKNIKNFVEEFNFSVINNIKMEEKKDISVIIKDKFLLTGFQLTKEDINENTVEDMISQLKILLVNDYIDNSTISVKDIAFYIKARAIINK